jgi:hypothetical protein
MTIREHDRLALGAGKRLAHRLGPRPLLDQEERVALVVASGPAQKTAS